ncbi:hypothetical protein GCM10010917_22370 [Paenibacillus physcomitrellae]|uniref:Branched-chain amino acid aminotransferase n=1 Tax=Paenibacillus physcomitrellae TaxID=1619311 RepID=A0ABQ1G3H9_9BACL|nr:hypothetical protein GCM10010917_22370 [Paenibacillus physcomitrellae]
MVVSRGAGEAIMMNAQGYVADEVFLTGTAAEVIAVREVDGRAIGEGHAGPMTLKLLEEFRSIVDQDGVKVWE